MLEYLEQMANHTIEVAMHKKDKKYKQGIGLLIANHLSIFKVTNKINAVAIRKISVYSKPAKLLCRTKKLCSFSDFALQKHKKS